MKPIRSMTLSPFVLLKKTNLRMKIPRLLFVSKLNNRKKRTKRKSDTPKSVYNNKKETGRSSGVRISTGVFKKENNPECTKYKAWLAKCECGGNCLGLIVCESNLVRAPCSSWWLIMLPFHCKDS